MYSRIVTIFSTLSLLIFYPALSQAALYDRGNGLIYDDVLGITWLQDANYPSTINATPSYHYGSMSFTNAKNFVDNLEYNGNTEWRLPSIAEGTITGFHQLNSELGHMFYSNLMNLAGQPLSNANFTDATTGLIKSFDNLESNFYWFNEESDDELAWAFKFQNGATFSYGNKNYLYKVWPVHDGDIANSADVAAVPVPASAFLFGSALIGLMITRRQANP